MFYSLKGTLTAVESNFIVVDCAGVGYKCMTSANTQRELSTEIGNEVLVFTHLNVRQDAVDLFAFHKMDELNCFKMLISVSGVGSRAGLAILSEFNAEQIAMFISSGNSAGFTKVSGIGNKTAQRIVLELKDKLKSTGNKENLIPMSGIASASKNITDAAQALAVLGYSQADVMPFLVKFDSNLTTQKLIQETLKAMGKEVR